MTGKGFSRTEANRRAPGGLVLSEETIGQIADLLRPWYRRWQVKQETRADDAEAASQTPR